MSVSYGYTRLNRRPRPIRSWVEIDGVRHPCPHPEGHGDVAGWSIPSSCWHDMEMALARWDGADTGYRITRDEVGDRWVTQVRGVWEVHLTGGMTTAEAAEVPGPYPRRIIAADGSLAGLIGPRENAHLARQRAELNSMYPPDHGPYVSSMGGIPPGETTMFHTFAPDPESFASRHPNLRLDTRRYTTLADAQASGFTDLPTGALPSGTFPLGSFRATRAYRVGDTVAVTVLEPGSWWRRFLRLPERRVTHTYKAMKEHTALNNEAPRRDA